MELHVIIHPKHTVVATTMLTCSLKSITMAACLGSMATLYSYRMLSPSASYAHAGILCNYIQIYTYRWTKLTLFVQLCMHMG